ncbi:MAG TPA: hypothetical protein VHU19_00495 [Pyrinomonadaceae bacterium]|nr:hypothetical protein [Pyrinomonadaceae bacterium]
MKNYRSRSVKDAARQQAAFIALLLIAAGTALAQGAPSGASAPGLKNPKGDTDIQTSREASLRSAEVGSTAGQVNQQHLAVAIEQTKQDFKRIQVIRNDMVDNLVARKPLDYKVISEQAAEVNKRASRLKTFLMPPAPDEKKKDEVKQVEYDEEALKGALVRLCNTIYSFTGNPMFKDPGTVDAQKATKAGGDLLNLIELSDNIKRSADRLGKSSK